MYYLQMTRCAIAPRAKARQYCASELSPASSSESSPTQGPTP
jgi:hypothetical protein